jgi:hypothetical protein
MYQVFYSRFKQTKSADVDVDFQGVILIEIKQT